MSNTKNGEAKINQAKIKKDNICAIFSSIASSSGISRANISKNTGLSLMTVGKVADILTSEGLVSQVKPATGNAGRRAGMLAISEKRFILSFDISNAKFRASVMDLSGKRLDSMGYVYNDSLFPEDNLVVFFRESSALLMKHLMDKKLSGVGICVSGEYDSVRDLIISPSFERLDGIKIADAMKRAMGFSPDRIMNVSHAAAISEIASLPFDRRGCTLNLTLDGGISGCVAFDEKILERRSSFDSIICENGRDLGRNLMESDSEEEIARHIGYALGPIISVLSPDAVFISSGERIFSEWFEEMVRSALGTRSSSITVVFENGKGARCDIGMTSLLVDDIISHL